MLNPSFSSRNKRAKIMIIADVPPEKGRGHYSYNEIIRQHLEESGASVMVVSQNKNHPGFTFGGDEAMHYDYEGDKEDFKSRVEEFDPDIVIFDTYPFWMFEQETYKSLIDEVYEENENRAKPFYTTVIRDIWSWREEVRDYINSKLGDFKRVFIRGVEGEHEEDEILQIIARNQIELERCGYIVDPWLYSEERDTLENNRDQIDNPILIHQGGMIPVPQYPDKAEQVNGFFIAISKAKAILKEKNSLLGDKQWKIFINPLYDQNWRKNIESVADSVGGISVQDLPEKIDYLKQLMSAALVVTRGGYNTTMELMTTRIPRVTLPFQQDDAEQIIRIEMLKKQNRGFVFIEPIDGVRFEGEDFEAYTDKLAQHLAQAIETAYTQRGLISKPERYEFEGGKNIASSLLKMATERKRKTQPSIEAKASGTKFEI